jgi:trk system potassium uptake protein TrkA
MRHQVMVIGLGRFGQAVARELALLGHEVLAIDSDERMVNDIAPAVTHALELDATDELALRAAGAADFRHAVVAISSHTEASIFATMALRKLGVSNVIAKAANALHGEILERVGATRVVYPEREIGQRVAHLFSVPEIVDYLDVAPGFGIQKVRPPEKWVGRTLGQLDLPGTLKLTPIAVRRGERVTVNPHASHTVEATDQFILIGLDERLEGIGD